MEQGKPPRVDDILSLTYSWIFEIVKYARHEDHWALTKEEASKLGKVTVACVNTVPAVTKAKVEARFNKYLPWAALLGFGIVITYPRVAISIENERKKGRHKPIQFPQPKEEPTSEQTVRVPPASTANGSTKNSGSNFPPSDRASFPKLDYEIPSPTDRPTG